jgi:uncharacterized protein (TIGR00725 family)
MKLEKLLNNSHILQIAVIGSHRKIKQYEGPAAHTGRLVAKHGHVLLTGACAGLPGIASKAALEKGGLSIGVAPGDKRLKNNQVSINTGFGFKGRNVILIRSADLVLCLPGGLGTLNELTIALDEGKACYFVGQNLTCKMIKRSDIHKLVSKFLI